MTASDAPGIRRGSWPCWFRRVAAVIALAAAPPVWGQAAPVRPGAVVRGRVATTITVAMHGRGPHADPIANLPLVLVDSAGRRLTIATDRDGAVTAILPRGRYRLVTARSVEWGGARYSWDIGIVVAPGVRVVALTQMNAASAVPVPGATPD